MAKAKFNPRKLMEMAIDAMRQSVAEPRADGKPNPLVGAVIYKADKTIETAHRGELRYGDHAEFTLLERKNRDQRLDGARLFATLEPCAPGARRHPKLGCAERIVLARISEVWVGIADPDPTVDRKGIQFLEDSGIKVHMFDRDLQEIIQAENKEFIDQALERAAAATVKVPKEIVLSKLELPVGNTAIDDFDPAALEQYRSIAKIEDAVDSSSFVQRLIHLGLANEINGVVTPTGFGLLLFGKEPRVKMRQAGILGTIHFADGGNEVKDFDGPQVLAPAEVLEWLRDKLPNPIVRSDARRREKNAAFFTLVREGVVNAIVHRDYGVEGAKCQLVVTNDTVTIKSPGQPVEPITLKQLQDFNAPMLSRNPALHYVFSQMELAEERGFGLASMKGGAQKASLPLPKYSWEAPYLVLTLFRNQEAATGSLASEVLASLSASEQKGWQWVSTKGRVSASQYGTELGVDARTARRHLSQFVKLGLVHKSGSGPATVYEVI